MSKISSKKLEKEGWISFELIKDEVLLEQREVDELALDTYKWALKLKSDKLKNNDKFMARVKDANDRKNKR